MRSSKSRSRGKNRNNNNNNRSMGNVVNRVFDSSGPEGKVRGTPQQIIDKYQQLHRDAQLSGDRVAAENFAQHAEHYARLLGEAMREQEARREQQEAQQAQAQAQQQARQQRDRDESAGDGTDGRNSRRGEDRKRDGQEQVDLQNAEQPDVIDLAADKASEDSGLVETVESAPAPKPRKPRTRKPKPVVDEAPAETASTDEKPAAE